MKILWVIRNIVFSGSCKKCKDFTCIVTYEVANLPAIAIAMLRKGYGTDDVMFNEAVSI